MTVDRLTINLASKAQTSHQQTYSVSNWEIRIYRMPIYTIKLISLILAGIAASGTTVISRVYHGLRGWENPIMKLRKIGVKIKKIS